MCVRDFSQVVMASTTTASTTASTTAGVASWSESLSTSLESQQPGPSGMTLGHLQLPFRQERPEQLSMGGQLVYLMSTSVKSRAWNCN